MAFMEISPREIPGNVIGRIADEWMLVAAGSPAGHNMMTASWGGMGELWGLDVAVTVLRPQRYTRAFVEKADRFSLTFFGGDKSMHGVCGSQSGRDVDKTALTGLTPVFGHGTVYFAQARLALICRKVYVQRIDPACFIDKTLDEKWYPEKDYHYMYVGAIEKALIPEE